MIYILGRSEQDCKGVHQTTQHGAQFKTYEFFICGIFHLMFSDHSGLGIIEAVKSKAVDKGWGTTVI